MRLNIHHTCGCSMLYGPFPANLQKLSMQPCPVCCAVERLNQLAERLADCNEESGLFFELAYIRAADIVMEEFGE